MSDHDRELTPMQKAVYFFDFFLYPSIVLACVLSDTARIARHPMEWGVMFLLGVALWTLAEYWIHRLVLHGPYWMDIHERHHKHPKELTVFPWWQIPTYFAAIGTLTYVFAGDWFAPWFAGILVGWMVYLVMHVGVEHGMTPQQLRRWPYLEGMARRHAVHHKVTNANFGLSTDIWDRAFGTLRDHPPRTRL